MLVASPLSVETTMQMRALPQRQVVYPRDRVAQSARSRDHRQEARHFAHTLRDALQQLVHVAVALRRLGTAFLPPRSPMLGVRDQGVHVEAVAGVGRDASRGGVRVGEETLGLQGGELRPNRRAARVHHLGESMAAHRCARGDVQLQCL